jgi:hypothetical protein
MANVKRMSNASLTLHTEYLTDQIDRTEEMISLKTKSFPDPYPCVTIAKLTECLNEHRAGWYKCVGEMIERSIRIPEKILGF